MDIYLVDISVTGRVRVQASSPEEAEYLARHLGQLGFAWGDGSKVFMPEVTTAKLHGKMENHTLQPVNTRIATASKMNGG